MGATTINCVIESQHKTCSLEVLVVQSEVGKLCCPILELPTCEKFKLIMKINLLEIDSAEHFINKTVIYLMA